MALIEPVEGRLTPILDDLESEIEQALSNSDVNPITTYLDMLLEPEVGAAVEAKILLGQGMLGDFQQENEDIQTFVRSSLSNMQGSFKTAVAQLQIADALGYAVSEWSVTSVDSKWQLKSIHALDPRNYEFRGEDGEISKIVYNSANKGEIDTPYQKCVHVVSGEYMSFGSPFGRAECRRALPAYLATKIVQNLMLKSVKTQATPALAAYAPNAASVNLLDAKGNPILKDDRPVKVPAITALHRDLMKLGSNGVIATDLENKIEVLSQQTDGVFFLSALAYLRSLKLMAFLVPETTFNVNGSGDSNLATNQSSLLHASVAATMGQIKEKLIECVIKPLIVYNFGEQEDYGKFATPEQTEIDKAALLGIISGAAANGSLGPLDLDVVNRNRDLAGIPKLEELVVPDGAENTFSFDYRGRLAA